MSTLVGRVLTALGRVYDPCSVVAAAPVSIVDMGLVTGIEVDARGRLVIELRTTSPLCTLVACLARATEEQVRRVPGVSTVEVRIDASQLWTEKDLSPDGRERLQARRRRSALEVPVAPRQWQRTARPPIA